MKRMLWVSVTCLLFACNTQTASPDSYDKNGRGSLDTSSADKKDNKDLIISIITLKDTRIDGCSGLFKDTSNKPSETEYTFATDLQSKAYAHINGKKLELKKTKANNSDGVIEEEYEGSGYKILLNVKEDTRLGDELFQYKGELIIKQSSNEKKISIVGEVGC